MEEVKLRTLKEIEITEDDWEEEDNIPKSKLRQEAIKWVKSWKNYKKITRTRDENIYLLSADKVFRMFFNLTEADLK